MEENWKEIEGYNGDYLISNLGKVKSLKNNKESILKLYKDRDGYYTIALYKNKIKKTFIVHRLVAKAFIENKDNKLTVNHINGIKTDNSLKNLEWATNIENIQHAWKTGLCKNTGKNAIIAQEAHKIPIYSKKLDIKFKSLTEAATYIKTYYFENSKLGCLKTIIGRLLNNKVTKSKYDFGWKFVK